MSEYLDMMNNLALRKNVQTKKVEKEVLRLYQDMYYRYKGDLKKVSPGSMKEAWLMNQMKAVSNYMTEVASKEEDIITQKMKTVINDINSTTEKYFNKAAVKGDLPKDLFTGMFTSMNDKVLKEVISGGLYKDNAGLSKRIWKDSKLFDKSIRSVIIDGLNDKLGVVDVANNLDKYLNPEVRLPGKYPKSTGKKIVDYNAYRLATTSISHAYQSSMARLNSTNPFMQGIEWSGGHNSGSCDLCKERNGKIFAAPVNKGNMTTQPLPLDHANGLCKNVPYIPDDLDKIGNRLNGWVKGEPDPELDDWFKNHGNKYTNVDDIRSAAGISPSKANIDSINYLKDKYGIDIDIDDTAKDVIKHYPPELTRMMNKYIDGIYSKYPKLSNKDYNLSYIRFEHRPSSKYEGSYSNVSNGMTINLKSIMEELTWGGQRKPMLDSDSNFSKFTQTFVHEMGHYLDASLSRRLGSKSLARDLADGSYRSFIDDKDLVSFKQMKKYLKDKGWKLTKSERYKQLGEYAETDLAEAMADAWGYRKSMGYIPKDKLYKNHINRGESDMAKDIVDFYEDLLKKEFGIPKKKAVKEFISMSHDDGVSQFKSWTDSLTDADKKEFRRYTTSYYKVINGALRRGQKLTESQQKLMDHMGGALKRSELKENIVVHRGSGLDAFGFKKGDFVKGTDVDVKEVKDKLLGTVFEDKGFMSTSMVKGKSFGSDVNMTIQVPAGKGKGAYIQPISAVSSEYEFLLSPGSKLIIKSIEEKIGYNKLMDKEYKYIDMVLEVLN